MAKKHSRRMSRKHKTHKRKHARRMRGGMAPVSGAGMEGMMKQSLAQGENYQNIHAAQHGGAYTPLGGAALQEALSGSSLSPNAAASRTEQLDAAYNAIKNMEDYPGERGGAVAQKGGKHRRGHKGRKGMKSRKGKSHKGRKVTRKGRKAMRKTRKGRKMRGGAAYDSNPAPFTGPSLLLSGPQMAKALSGMNAEWKLAENPAAFAPGVAKNY